MHFVHCLRTHSCHTVVEHSSTLDSIWQKIMFGYKNNFFFAFYRITFVKPVSRLFVRFLVLGPLVHIICLSVEFNIFGPDQPKHYNHPDQPKHYNHPDLNTPDHPSHHYHLYHPNHYSLSNHPDHPSH